MRCGGSGFTGPRSSAATCSTGTGGGIHLYTLNRSTATREIFVTLGVKDSTQLQGRGKRRIDTRVCVVELPLAPTSLRASRLRMPPPSGSDPDQCRLNAMLMRGASPW